MKKFVYLFVFVLLFVYAPQSAMAAPPTPADLFKNFDVGKVEADFGHGPRPEDSSAVIPNGLDKHKAAFGPKIKGIQLGTAVTVSDFIDLTNKYLTKGSSYDGNWFLMTFNSMRDIAQSATWDKFVLYDSKKKQWKFNGDYPEYKQFLAQPRIVLAPGKLGFYNEFNPAWCAIKAGNDFRIAVFTLPFSAFDAKGMSPQNVAREMTNNYGIRKFNTGGLLGGLFWVTDDADNYTNGWSVVINGMDETVVVSITETGGGGSFN
jgi:hypothetical protein